MKRWLLIVIGLAPSGCFHHFETNAPKVIDVETPPSDIALEAAELPRDSGHHVFLGAVGPFGTLGRTTWNEGSHRRQSSFGLEMSFTYGWFPKSILFPFLLRGGQVTLGSVGLNMGWTFLEKNGPNWAPLYFEAYFGMLLFAVSAGLAADFRRDKFGPQVTFWTGPLYVRVSKLVGERRDVVIGVALELPLLALSWSK